MADKTKLERPRLKRKPGPPVLHDASRPVTPYAAELASDQGFGGDSQLHLWPGLYPAGPPWCKRAKCGRAHCKVHPR